MTRLSILIPAFNCADILPECLEALQNQSVKPLEIIVIDDGSRDETADVAERSEGVKVVRRPEQGGAGAARATGAQQAKGDIIAFIDSDCVAPTDWVEKISNAFKDDPEIVAVGGMYRHCHSDSLIAHFGKFEEEYLHTVFARTPYASTLTGGNMAVRRDIWNSARSGRELIHFQRVASSEDTVVANEIRAVGKTLFTADIFVSHLPKNNFLKSLIKRNITRARTRMISKLNGLGKGGDNVFAGFGGFRLFWAAAALWASALAILTTIIFPSAWAWALGSAALLTLLHSLLAYPFFQFIHSNHERPCPVRVGVVEDLGLRALVSIRAACWVIGACTGVVQHIAQRARHFTNIALSIFHFWMPGRISKLFYFVTSKCNARCEFCFNLDNVINWQVRQKDELKLEEVTALAESFGRLPYVTFSGGEPFARVDLPSVVRQFRENSKTQWITIPTNGALTKRVVDGVVEMLTTCPGLFLTVQFSIDSLNEAHDESRKIKGGFEAMLETARQLARLRLYYPNLRLQINTPYDTINLKDIDSIRDFCKDNIDFDQQLFYMFREDGILISDENTHLADGFLDFIQKHDADEWKERGRNLWGRAVRALQSVTYEDIRKIKKDKQFIRPCYATQKFITLYDDGTFAPCEVLASTSLGNIRDHGYDFYRMKKAVGMNRFHKEEIVDTKCNCEWMCAPTMNMLYDPPTWWRIARNLLGGIKKKN